jgi:hypothetical protein
VVLLGDQAERLPFPEFYGRSRLPLIRLDAHAASAPSRIRLALKAACRETVHLVGAFAA